jgi:hypothetical protein
VTIGSVEGGEQKTSSQANRDAKAGAWV